MIVANGIEHFVENKTSEREDTLSTSNRDMKENKDSM